MNLNSDNLKGEIKSISGNNIKKNCVIKRTKNNWELKERKIEQAKQLIKKKGVNHLNTLWDQKAIAAPSQIGNNKL